VVTQTAASTNSSTNAGTSGSSGDATSDGTTDAPSTGEGSTSDGGSSTGLLEVDYEADVQPMLNARCTCHLAGPSGNMVAPLMNLNPGNSYAQLVGVASEQVPTLNRVQAGDSAQSYLYAKLTEAHLDAGGEGTKMPPGTSLDESMIAIIHAWILGGALP
jgi:hypothetical protein